MRATSKLTAKKKRTKVSSLFFCILFKHYFFFGVGKNFLLKSTEIAAFSNLIFPAPVSIVTVLSLSFNSTNFP